MWTWVMKWNSTFVIELNEWIECKSIECKLSWYEIMNESVNSLKSNVMGKLNKLEWKSIWC